MKFRKWRRKKILEEVQISFLAITFSYCRIWSPNFACRVGFETFFIRYTRKRLLFSSFWENATVTTCPCKELDPVSPTCRQVVKPQIAHFQVEKWKSSLPWEGDPPPPSPLGRYAPSGLVASLPRKDCPPPQMFWLITPLLGAPPPPPQCVDPRYTPLSGYHSQEELSHTRILHPHIVGSIPFGVFFLQSPCIISFSGLKIHLHTKSINVHLFLYLWHGTINGSILTKH